MKAVPSRILEKISVLLFAVTLLSGAQRVYAQGVPHVRGDCRCGGEDRRAREDSSELREESAVKNLAFVVGLFILALGAVGVLMPSSLVWIAHRSDTSAAFYVIGAVRVAFGLVLISVASVSRAPRTLRVFGYFVVIAGLAAALMGVVAMEHARGIIEWWLRMGSGVIRLTGLVILAVGGFVAYACAPIRRAA